MRNLLTRCKHSLRKGLTGTLEIFLGQSTSSVLSAASVTTGIVVVLAVLGQVGHNVIARRFLAEAADVQLTLRRERLRRALHRVDLVEPAPGSLAQLFARPLLEAAITVVAAWVLWTAIGAIIDKKMPRAVSPGEAGQAVPGSASRLRHCCRCCAMWSSSFASWPGPSPRWRDWGSISGRC